MPAPGCRKSLCADNIGALQGANAGPCGTLNAAQVGGAADEKHSLDIHSEI